MANTTKKPAAKTTTKAAKTTTFNINKKLAISFVLAIVVIISAAVLYQSNNIAETKINTPVIARTELNKKPAIDIKLFDKNAPVEEQTEATEVTEEKTPELEPVVTNLTNLELKQTALEEKLTALEKATQVAKIDQMNAKITKLEALNGNLGNLSKIFLGQQLVLLDNAFKVGGNQNLAIENIYSFAKNVAKNEAVATKLQSLLTLTNQQAIITPAALNFYAAELLNVEITTAHIQKQEVAVDASVMEKIKAFLKSFIMVRKLDEVTAEQELWDVQILALQKAIIFGNFIKVEEILKDQDLQKLGGENFTNFANLFKTYLTQQQALQATLGAFIEGYNYDY